MSILTYPFGYIVHIFQIAAEMAMVLNYILELNFQHLSVADILI